MAVEIPVEVAPFLDALAKVTANANEVRARYLAATKKPDESWKAIAEGNADHPAVVKFLEVEAQIETKIKELQERKKEFRAQAISAVTGEQESTISEEEAKALKEEFVNSRKKVRLTRDNILALLDGDETAFNEYVKARGIEDVPNLGGGAAKSSSSGDIVRLRISDAWVDKEPVADAKGKVSFTTLASHLKVDGDVLRNAAASAAGVSSVRDLPKGQDVEFTITVNDVEHNVVIRPALPTKKSDD